MVRVLSKHEPGRGPFIPRTAGKARETIRHPRRPGEALYTTRKRAPTPAERAPARPLPPSELFFSTVHGCGRFISFWGIIGGDAHPRECAAGHGGRRGKCIRFRSQLGKDGSTVKKLLAMLLVAGLIGLTTGCPGTTTKPPSGTPTTSKTTPTTHKPVVPATTDKPTTDKPTTDKPTTDKKTTDKPTTDKPTTDKPTTDKPTTDKPTTDKKTTDKPTTDKKTTDK